MCEIGTFLGIGKVTKLEITKFEIGGDKVRADKPQEHDLESCNFKFTVYSRV